MGAKLGQNFLVSTKYITFIINKVSELFQTQKFEIIFEIGPGKGVLTKALVKISNNIFVFELDSQFSKNLEGILGDKKKVIIGDILDLDVKEFMNKNNIYENKVLLIGNIPYYITSPIFKKFFRENILFEKGVFLIQKEVAEKIKSDAKKKSYLRYLLNYSFEIKYLKTVGAKAFSPSPKVDSAFVLFTKKQLSENIDKQKLLNFLNNVSPYKRKTLGKIQKILSKKSMLPDGNNPQNGFLFEIPGNLLGNRLEQLSRRDISNILT